MVFTGQRLWPLAILCINESYNAVSSGFREVSLKRVVFTVDACAAPKKQMETDSRKMDLMFFKIGDFIVDVCRDAILASLNNHCLIRVCDLHGGRHKYCVSTQYFFPSSPY